MKAASCVMIFLMGSPKLCWAAPCTSLYSDKCEPDEGAAVEGEAEAEEELDPEVVREIHVCRLQTSDYFQ